MPDATAPVDEFERNPMPNSFDMSEGYRADAIDHARGMLASAVDDADRGVASARRQVAMLAGSLYDVEYAEGDPDVAHFLADAARSLRAAGALMPKGSDGA